MPLAQSLVPETVFADRRKAAMEVARSRSLDALLVWGRGGETGESVNDILFYANHFSAYPGQPPVPGYLSGVEHAALLITGEGRGTLLVSGFVSEDAQADEVRSGMDLSGLLRDTLREIGLSSGRVGLIGSEALPYPIGADVIRDFPGLALEAADEIGTTQRMEIEEIDLVMLRNAAEVGTAIVAAIASAAVPGATEGEAVGAGLALAARTPGCIHWAFMIASGPDAHLFVRDGTPAWNPTYVYQEGDVVHIDAYGFVFGYQYDLMRTSVVGGKPSPAQERNIAASRDVIGSIAGSLTEGVTPRALRDKALLIAEQTGQDASGNATFGHGINHGWAGPFLQEPMDRPGVDLPLHPPCAFAFETFLDDGAGHYSKWEDMYVWLPDGVERLTGAGPATDLNAPLWPF